MTSPLALVISGGGRFVDSWHPFPATSAVLTGVLRDRGYAVRLREDADAGLAALPHEPLPSLLVINIGWSGADRLSDPATDGLVSALRAGLPTLIVHSTLTAPDQPVWNEIAGGGWTRGTTYHPDYGPGVAIASPDHPVTTGLDELMITDERYTLMWVADTSAVFLEHEEAGQRHPLAWTRVWGASPILVDALGHDAAAYQAGDRLTLLHRELDWLRSPAPSVPPS